MSDKPTMATLLIHPERVQAKRTINGDAFWIQIGESETGWIDISIFVDSYDKAQRIAAIFNEKKEETS